MNILPDPKVICPMCDHPSAMSEQRVRFAHGEIEWECPHCLQWVSHDDEVAGLLTPEEVEAEMEVAA